jgi:hypothetical protein
VPLGLIKVMTRAFGWLPFFPVTMDQIIMLEEGNVTDPTRFYADFNMTPEPLALGLRRMFPNA